MVGKSIILHVSYISLSRVSCFTQHEEKRKVVPMPRVSWGISHVRLSECTHRVNEDLASACSGRKKKEANTTILLQYAA